MKILAIIFSFAIILAVICAVISFVRFAYVHVKAYVIRRRLVKRSESEHKDD